MSDLGKKDRRYLRTQTALKQEFLNMLKKQPIEKITVTRLCRQADVNRTTFYTHYADVYDLLSDIEQDRIYEITKLYQSILKDSQLPEEVVKQILEYIRTNRVVLSVILNQPSRNVFWDTIDKKIQELFRLKTEQEYIRPEQMSDEEYRNLILFLSNGFYAIYSKWMKDDCRESMESLADFTTAISSHCLAGMLIKKKK